MQNNNEAVNFKHSHLVTLTLFVLVSPLYNADSLVKVEEFLGFVFC